MAFIVPGGESRGEGQAARAGARSRGASWACEHCGSAVLGAGKKDILITSSESTKS